MEQNMNSKNKHEVILTKLVGIAAAIVIVAAIVLSPTVLGFLLAPDGKIGNPKMVAEVQFFRILCGFLAAVLFVIRNKVVVYLTNHPQVFASLIGLGGIVGIIGAVELSLAYANRASKDAVVLESSENRHTPTQLDKDLGYRPIVSSKIRVIKKSGDQVLYDAHYSHDSMSRRIVPSTGDDQSEKDIAIFFGDSFTYGEGVNDDETMPYFYSKATGSYQSFNYGFSGYGPQNMLAMLENDSYLAPVVEKIKQKGANSCPIILYTFIDHHIMRALGSLSVMTYGQDLPYYQLQNGEIKRTGSFSSDRKFTTKALRFLSHSKILKTLKVEFPVKVDDNSLDTTVKIIARSRDLAAKKINKSNFFVILYPGTTLASVIKTKLEALNVNVLDYTGTDSKFDMATMTIPIDRHPNGAGHRHIADCAGHRKGALYRPSVSEQLIIKYRIF